MSINTKALIAASLFASIGTVSTAAVAGEVRLNERGEPMIEIDYTDLNLNSPAGQRALEARISRAAMQVCDVYKGRVSLREARSRNACFKNAKSQALLAFKNGNQGPVAARATSSRAQ